MTTTATDPIWRTVTGGEGMPPEMTITFCREQDAVGLDVGQPSRGFSPEEARAVALALTVAADAVEHGVFPGPLKKG